MKDIMNKYKGMTFAQAAKKVDKKYKGWEIDSLKSKAREQEMRKLSEANDKARAIEMYKSKAKEDMGIATNNVSVNGSVFNYGGVLEKYAHGGKTEEYAYGGKLKADLGLGITDPNKENNTSNSEEGMDYLDFKDKFGYMFRGEERPDNSNGATSTRGGDTFGENLLVKLNKKLVNLKTMQITMHMLL